MVVHSASPVSLGDGRQAVLVGGMLLNQNLVFIDTINDLVYRAASLPAGTPLPAFHGNGASWIPSRPPSLASASQPGTTEAAGLRRPPPRPPGAPRTRPPGSCPAPDGCVALVSTSTSTSGPQDRSDASTSMPSIPGSLRTSGTISGRSDVASDTAVGPSPASPATTMPSCTSRSTQPVPDHRMVAHQEHAATSGTSSAMSTCCCLRGQTGLEPSACSVGGAMAAFQNKVVLRCVAGPDVVQFAACAGPRVTRLTSTRFAAYAPSHGRPGWPGRPARTMSIAQSTTLFAGRLRNRHALAGAGHGVKCRKSGITDAPRDTPQAHLEPERCLCDLNDPRCPNDSQRRRWVESSLGWDAHGRGRNAHGRRPGGRAAWQRAPRDFSIDAPTAGGPGRGRD